MNNQDVLHKSTIELPVPKTHGTRRSYQEHGLTSLIRARYKANAGKLDGRYWADRALNQYRADLVSSLGGADNLSIQEMTIIELCAKDKLIVDSIDAYLLTVGLFSKRKKSAFPLLIQRQTIADGLTRRLLALGLTRRSKPVIPCRASSQPPRQPSQVDTGTTIRV
jgi:hypothetical protein